MKEEENKKISRRSALKYLGIGAVGVAGVAAGINFLPNKNSNSNPNSGENPETASIATRKHKATNADISLLGFGCMRFPVLKEGEPAIDEAQALEMIDYAYKNGVNYFDTAWFYHQGLSEPFVGKALKKYPRESFNLATKMPTPLIDSLDKAKDIFSQQLQRCQVDYFDFYLLHSLKSFEQYNEVYEANKIYDYLMEEKAKGRIKRLGFSFHGPKEEFPKILDARPWEFAMIQANYLDWNIDGQYLYDALAQRNIQCVIMEPVRGGLLATLNDEAVEIFENANSDRSVASWAIQYMASKPNVLTVLSGMSAMEHVQDNIKTVTNFKPMTDEEQAVVQKALKAFLKVDIIPCTFCDYCIPCPAGVAISKVFNVYNRCVSEHNVPDMTLQRDSDKTKQNPDFERQKRAFLSNFNEIPKRNQPSRCTSCKECIPKCPQAIQITDKMQEIAKLLADLQ
jgi:predicted aldo/keto reductase-like oxidoreductase